MTAEKTTRRPGRINFDGRVLYLTEDVSLIRRQLEAGEELGFDPARPLMNNISTDEITPGWVCFYYDETLGEYVYVGMREGAVKKDEVKNGGFAVVVSGLSKGCGSSRETAPFAEKAAGLQLVIAKTIEKIYGQNCQNIGLLTSTDFGLVERIRRGEALARRFGALCEGMEGAALAHVAAPFAEKAAGLQLVIAKTIEKIYGQNCQNIGLLTSTDFGLIERIKGGEEIPLEEFTRGLDPISRQIVEYGGLFNYNKARLAGEVTPPAVETKRRPMNIVEKIVARHAFVRAGEIGVEAVKPSVSS